MKEQTIITAAKKAATTNDDDDDDDSVFLVVVRLNSNNTDNNGTTPSTKKWMITDEVMDKRYGTTLSLSSSALIQKEPTTSTPSSTPSFTFDRVYSYTIEQEPFFHDLVEPHVDNFLSNKYRDLTVIAYGQTCSGKTWSIDGNYFSDQSSNDTKDRGILPRLLTILRPLGTVHMSYYEIYCERIVDLFSDATKEKQREIILYNTQTTTTTTTTTTNSQNVYMKGLTWKVFSDSEEALSNLRKLYGGRHFAATSMNANSSRSHTIVDLRFYCTNGQEKRVRVVDLAGSERCNRVNTAGKTFDEGVKINQSLMFLRETIKSLSSNSNNNNNNNSQKSSSIRCSKLTRILYPSFLGNAKVILLICCSTRMENINETISSLNFGSVAKKLPVRLVKEPLPRVVNVLKKRSTTKSEEDIWRKQIDELQADREKLLKTTTIQHDLLIEKVAENARLLTEVSILRQLKEILLEDL